MKIDVDTLFPAMFDDDFKSIIVHEKTEYIEAGGRGSCKSSFISVVIVFLILSNKNFNALVLRKVSNTLRDSVFEQIKWACGKLKVSKFFKFIYNPLMAVYIPTGQKIFFRGADDPLKLKSIKTSIGYIALAWFEEWSEFSPSDFSSIKLSALRGGDIFYTFCSFNPPSSVRSWVNAEMRTPKENRFIHKTDYRGVPKNWLGDAFLFEAEELKKSNERAYRNIFLGEATGTGRNIFENIEIREIRDEEIESFDFIYRGIDWGFYPDPFVFGAMSFNPAKQTLYIFSELYLYKCGNYESFQKTKEHMEKNKMNIYVDRITADSAEPKSIADFRAWGANVRGAVKGMGSLSAGFKWLQGLKKIIIDPARCPRAADEFSLYEYEIDKKTGEILPGYPQGQPDHFMALTRYAMESIWRHGGE